MASHEIHNTKQCYAIIIKLLYYTSHGSWAYHEYIPWNMETNEMCNLKLSFAWFSFLNMITVLITKTCVNIMGKTISMALCKTVVSPLLTQWRYDSLAVNHWYVNCLWNTMNCLWNTMGSYEPRSCPLPAISGQMAWTQARLCCSSWGWVTWAQRQGLEDCMINWNSQAKNPPLA